MIDIEKLKELAAAATRGAWRHTRQGVIVAGPFRQYTNGSAQSQIASFCVTSHEDDDEHQTEKQVPNALFSAAACPDTVLELIAMASAAAPQVVADDGLVPFSVDGKSVWLEGIGAVALDYSSVKLLSDIQDAAAPVQAVMPELPEPWINNLSSGIQEESRRHYAEDQMIDHGKACFAAGLTSVAPVQAQEPRKPTDLSARLRSYIGQNLVPYPSDVLAAANEIERYYGGMLNWKATAEAKDSAPVQPVAVPDGLKFDILEAINIACERAVHAGSVVRRKKWESATAQFKAYLANCAAPAAQPSTVAVLDGWPTDEMVIRGAEQLQDCLRWAGVVHDFDADLKGTEIQQDIAESVFKSMLELAAPAAQGDTKELTDEQIKEVAINYASHVAGDVYDVTKYDCAEDFFNCVRAAIAAKAAS